MCAIRYAVTMTSCRHHGHHAIQYYNKSILLLLLLLYDYAILCNTHTHWHSIDRDDGPIENRFNIIPLCRGAITLIIRI